MEWYLAYLILGAVAGFLAGLFGVGGGLVLVPVLLLMFDAQQFTPEHTMHLALGTAMATILFTSIASMRKHHQHGAVNWQVVRHITPGILLGTAIGALTASAIPVSRAIASSLSAMIGSSAKFPLVITSGPSPVAKSK